MSCVSAPHWPMVGLFWQITMSRWPLGVGKQQPGDEGCTEVLEATLNIPLLDRRLRGA